MHKKIAIALSLLGLNSAVFAGHVGDSVVVPTGVNLVAPDTVGVWSFGAEILYMKPTANFQYGTVQSINSDTIYHHNQSVDSSYSFGGTVDLAYLIPGSARDVKLSFTNLCFKNSANSQIAGENNGQIFITPFNTQNLSTLNGDGSSVKGTQEQDYIASDLLFGQWIRIGHRVDLHPFAGVRFADIDNTDKANYFDTDTAITQTAKFDSDFEGIGPRVGLDTAVHLGWGISFVGTVGGSLIVGNVDSDTTTVNPSSSTVKLNNGDDTQVIPELDARIGLNYLYNFNPTNSMSIELGFQDVNYFDVVDNDYLDATTANTMTNSDNFSYQGWYARFQFNFA